MKTVLIIEDEVALQDALNKVLGNNGYNVLQAFDGDEGLQLVRDQKPDLVLLDLVLPKKHGFDVLKAMKEDKELSSIAVIVLTNLEGSEEVMKAIELGANTYLVKANYTLQEVVAKVQDALK